MLHYFHFVCLARVGNGEYQRLSVGSIGTTSTLIAVYEVRHKRSSLEVQTVSQFKICTCNGGFTLFGTAEISPVNGVTEVTEVVLSGRCPPDA